MLRNSAIFFLIFLYSSAFASPVLQMNAAFEALSDLIPYISDRDKFMDKKNEAFITKKMTHLQSAFKSAGHDTAIKEDLFAPSYALIYENISNDLVAFKDGKKDYARWRLKEITPMCLDCHTRLPVSHSSSFQDGKNSIDKSKFGNVYDLGIAQLIVRRYADAKESFIRSIQDKIIKKETSTMILSFKQIMLIEAKVLKSPENLTAFFNEYLQKKDLPDDLRRTVGEWSKRVSYWKGNELLTKGFKDEKSVKSFIEKELVPIQKKDFYQDGNDVDLLVASGLLSNYFFEHPNSTLAPEINYWLGWSEKNLKREDFFGSGDLFLKQCVKRYPTHPISKKCLQEYKDSVEFEFSGSLGTNLPADIQKELDSLEKTIKLK
jgi:hypothetical protein